MASKSYLSLSTRIYNQPNRTLSTQSGIDISTSLPLVITVGETRPFGNSWIFKKYAEPAYVRNVLLYLGIARCEYHKYTHILGKYLVLRIISGGILHVQARELQSYCIFSCLYL